MKIDNIGGCTVQNITTKSNQKVSLKSYHSLNIMIDLFLNECYSLQNGKTATDYHCSNGNQYLVELEHKGLITRAKYRCEKFKRAYIPDLQYKAVIDYLSHKGVDILTLKQEYQNKKYTA